MAHSSRSARLNDADVETKKKSSFFERRDHRDSVIRGLLDGVLPLKFAYAGSAAHTHDLLAQGAGYQSVTGAVTCVSDAVVAAGMRDCGRIVEIGPGNGVSSIALLRSLGVRHREFLGLDFSETLLGLARRNFHRDTPEIDFAERVWDVEAGPTREIRKWRDDSGVLPILFLGNTIGNFERPAPTVGNILDSIEPGDILFLGVTLQAADPDAMIAPYRTAVFRNAALEPLLALGIESLDLEVAYDPRAEAVIGTAILGKRTTVSEHDLPAGHRVRCFLSRRFTAAEIESIITEAGGVVRRLTADPAGEHAVFAVTKK